MGQTLHFGEYRPDVSDLNQAFTQAVLNVLPRADGYGPMKSVAPYTSALAAQCRGLFFARNTDGSVAIFAGTQKRLYLLDNTTLTWTDVSKGAADYSQLDNTANWTFVQFNSVVIACQANSVPQAYTLGSSSAFADLGGSPPQAAYVAVVNRFVVLSGLLSTPRRVQWSGLNAITTWSPGDPSFSDFQDLADGGNTRGVVGGEVGLIVQDNSIRRMTFTPGAATIFQIDRIARDIGTAYPYSIVDANGLVAFHSTKGFQLAASDGTLKPIGFQRVDKSFLDAVDLAHAELVIGSSVPGTNLVLWAYKETTYNGSGWNRLLAYDIVLDRWAPIAMTGEYLACLAKPGVTLDGLGKIGSVAVTGAANNGSGLVRLTVASTAGWSTGDKKAISSVGGTTEANGIWTVTVVDGTHIDLQGTTYANAYTSGGYVEGSLDALPFSLDDLAAATLDQMAVIDTSHTLGYLTGDALEATLESAEQSTVDKRLFVRGYFPVTDAASAYASTGARENLNSAPAWSGENALNAQGFCPQRTSTRHARAKVRIPAATIWSYITGVVPDFAGEGKR